ncbi:hypothetical protein E1A91_D02G200100v1 [Gossypium mustelinum]|uniref:NAD(P)H-quinone oxidoreductase subunit 6, chloroplastic n=1 Tax=Gossypium mustelinum TaxID=34275 RepID=A0A5D2VYJ9_GOSMU|nr:hypothetical protein E1A91_D02G200100v1 [Gossypium mustelinum]
MDLPGPIQDFLLVFLGSSLILRGMGVLLIYVGAINVLMLFAMMFINSSKYYKDFNLWTIGNDLTSLVCTSILVSLITTILDFNLIWTTRSNQIIEQDLISNSQQIGNHLATHFFLPF